MRILFVGDIFGKPGLRTLNALLPEMKRVNRVDLVIANGENSASGFGVTTGTAREMFSAGVDVITTGNHVWDRREIMEKIDDMPRLLRPANLAPPVPGNGWCVVEAAGLRVAVINLVGRVFMDPVDCPFRTADSVLRDLKDMSPDAIVVDFHAEATSEKQALGHYLDGRVSAIVGTHTHVPTADARTLPGGTAFISDVGMTGVLDSIIGLDRDRITQRFLTGMPVSAPQAQGRGMLCGALIEIEKNRNILRRIDAFEP